MEIVVILKPDAVKSMREGQRDKILDNLLQRHNATLVPLDKEAAPDTTIAQIFYFEPSNGASVPPSLIDEIRTSESVAASYAKPAAQLAATKSTVLSAGPYAKFTPR
jgi:hypothetical protein